MKKLLLLNILLISLQLQSGEHRAPAADTVLMSDGVRAVAVEFQGHRIYVPECQQALARKALNPGPCDCVRGIFNSNRDFRQLGALYFFAGTSLGAVVVYGAMKPKQD